MNKCFLRGYGECSNELSREHYISATVLQAISKGKNEVPIGGLSWQPDDTLQTIGISSLQSKILCTKHNSNLSELDNIAGQFYRLLDNIDKAPDQVPSLSQFCGESIERWFLKVLCGLIKSSGFRGYSFSPVWLEILCGGQWPDFWGLYVPIPKNKQILNNEFYAEIKINSGTKEILAVLFRIAGVPFYMVFGKPDDPSSFGLYRPRGLIFDTPTGEYRIEFLWKNENNQAVTYRKLGTTKGMCSYNNVINFR